MSTTIVLKCTFADGLSMPDRSQVITAIQRVAELDQTALLKRVQLISGLRQVTQFADWLADTVGCDCRSVFYWLSEDKNMSPATRFALAGLEISIRLADGSFDDLDVVTPAAPVNFTRYPPPK